MWDEDNYYNIDDFRDNAFLPIPVKEYYGFPSYNPNVKLNEADNKKLFKEKSDVYNRTNSVSYLNDHGFTFSEIADIIERTYLNE